MLLSTRGWTLSDCTETGGVRGDTFYIFKSWTDVEAFKWIVPIMGLVVRWLRTVHSDDIWPNINEQSSWISIVQQDNSRLLLICF